MSDATRIVDLVVPRLGETMEEGVVRDWLKAVGDTFERGDSIVEIETDKTIAELPALAAGRLIEVLAASGDRLAIGAPLGRIEVEADDAGSAASGAIGTSADMRLAHDNAGPVSTPVSEKTKGEPLRATPAARKHARSLGVDLASVRGTGRRGRVEVSDVAPAASSTAAGGSQALDEIAFDLDGPNDGDAFVLLHGFAADRSSWAAVRQGLLRAGCRVLAPDLPGHGASRREAECVEALADGLEALVDATFGATPVHLVAHSLGAVAALALAKRPAVASLTLIAPAGIGLHIDRDFVRGIAAPASSGELTHLLRRLTSRPLPLSVSAIVALQRELARGRLAALADAMLGQSGQTLDLVPAITNVSSRVPVRVIVGHADRIMEWRDACALSPVVAVHHLIDAGHVPHWDAPNEVLAILELSRQAAGSRPRVR